MQICEMREAKRTLSFCELEAILACHFHMLLCFGLSVTYFNWSNTNIQCNSDYVKSYTLIICITLSTSQLGSISVQNKIHV